MDTIAGLPRSAWIALGVPIGLALLALFAKQPANTGGDWKRLQPTIPEYALAIFAILISPGLAIFGWIGLFGPKVAGIGPHAELIAPFMLLYSILFPYAASITFFTTCRFNSDGFEKSWFGRPTFFPWPEIKKLDRSIFLGPRLVTRSGRSVPVSQYLRGFPELVLMAHSKGVEVAEEFSR